MKYLIALIAFVSGAFLGMMYASSEEYRKIYDEEMKILREQKRRKIRHTYANWVEEGNRNYG